jgi:hypothetical protein
MAFLVTAQDPSNTFSSSSSGSSPRSPPLPFLPSGSIVSGLPAGLITQCQIRGTPASLIVSVDTVPHLIPVVLSQLAAAMANVLEVQLPGTAAAAAGGAGVAEQLVAGLRDQELVQAAKQQCQKHMPAPSLYA